jgi:hypothetical protein
MMAKGIDTADAVLAKGLTNRLIHSLWVRMRLKRGSFAATWFLAVLAALELDGVALEEI